MSLINDKTTPQKVAEHIIKKIQKGNLKPGDSLLPEAEMQQKLGVSRFSLREGLARLEALGIIESKRGQRTRVSDGIDPERLAEIFVPLSTNYHYTDFLLEARTMQQSDMMILASKRRTKEQLKVLETCYSDANLAINAPKQFAVHFLEFHLELCRICQNPFLETTLLFLVKQTQFVFDRECESMEKRKQLACDLKRIVEGLRNRETESLKQFMIRHLTPKKEKQEVELPAIQTSLLN